MNFWIRYPAYLSRQHHFPMQIIFSLLYVRNASVQFTVCKTPSPACECAVIPLFSSPSQFYRCFLILFHCDRWSSEKGDTSVPSKTTVIHLNRRVYSNTVACTAQISTEALNQCYSTADTKHTIPPEVTPWTWALIRQESPPSQWSTNNPECELWWTVDKSFQKLDVLFRVMCKRVFVDHKCALLNLFFFYYT